MFLYASRYFWRSERTQVKLIYWLIIASNKERGKELRERADIKNISTVIDIKNEILSLRIILLAIPGSREP